MRCGIEAEYLVLGPDGLAIDTDLTRAAPDPERMQRIVDRLPDHGDADLTRGDLAIKWSRWYVEGDERFDEAGTYLRCVTKGIETRTPVRPGPRAALNALAEQTRSLAGAAYQEGGCTLAGVGRHPWRGSYRPDPEYNAWERDMRRTHREYAAPEVYMCTFGPDVNLSHADWDAARSLQVATRLAEHAAALVVFSLNAPYAGGRRRPGLSARTSVRAGRRPVVRLFLDEPRLTELRARQRRSGRPARLPAGVQVHRARIPSEHGRIEFKAFDAVADLPLLGGLLALCAGVASATEVPAVPHGWGKLTQRDRLRRCATTGLHDDGLREWSAVLLDAAKQALPADEAALLDPVRRLHTERRVPAEELIDLNRDRRPGTPIRLPPLHYPTP